MLPTKLNHKSYLTAIARKDLPAPTKWLQSQRLIKTPVLDYGCGKCHSVNPKGWINYDPHWHKIDIDCFKGSFITVICNYVLCTLPSDEQITVLKDIQPLLMDHEDAVAYISVRNDKPKQGWGLSKRKTYQGRTRNLPLVCIYKNSQFRIYRLTRNDILV